MPSAADFLGQKPQSASAFLDATTPTTPDPPPKPKPMSATSFLAAPPHEDKPKGAPSASSFLAKVPGYVAGKVSGAVGGAFNDLKTDAAALGRAPDLKHGVGGYLKGEAKSASQFLKLPGDAMALATSPLTGAINTVGDPLKKATSIPERTVKGTKLPAVEGIDLNQAIMGARSPEGAAEAVSGIGKAVKGVGKAFERILSPATVDDNAKATALLHRKAFGVRGTEADAEARRLSFHQKVVGNAPPEDQRATISYIESRSKGATVAPKYQKAADAIRDVFQRYRSRIETVLGDDKDGGPSFVQDYYVHMWKNPAKEVEGAVGIGGKQGSGRNLKARSLPTYEDGLKAGLTPKYPNLIDATSAYIDNMARFLATHDVQNAMKAAGLAKMVPESQVPEGWVKLNGVRSTEEGRPFIRSDGEAGMTPRKVLVAPEGAARVYNNHISKGLEGGDFGPFYRGARAAVNGMVQLKLGLSAFHASTMAQEGFVGQVAKGLGQLSRGKIEGAGSIAKAPFAPITLAKKGEDLKGQLLEYRAPTEMGQKVAKAYREAGGRVHMDRMYSASGSGTFWNSMKRGTLKRDVGDAVKRLYTGSMGERAKGVAELTGNLIQTTAAPIFEEYVPRMKMGAFASRMEAFFKDNPNASEAEQGKYAAKLVDTIDNRFGELQTDNLFWHKTAYQLAQLALLSPSWDVGTAREIGGGIIEIPKSLAGVLKGKGVTDKTAYVAALVGTTMVQNGVLTKLHTGENPEGQDFFAYRTGGKDKNGQPERAIMPSYMKDVLAFGWQFPANVIPEASNKLNPGLNTTQELTSNKDYRGDPIYRPPGVEPQDDGDNRLKEIATYLANQMAPISLSQKKNPDSGLTGAEKFLGVKQAPSYLEDPDRVRGNEAKYGGRDWKKKLRHDQQDAQ